MHWQSGGWTSSVHTYRFTWIIKCYRILTLNAICHYSKSTGWSIYPNMSIPSLTSKERTTLWSVADALSWLPEPEREATQMNAIFQIDNNLKLFSHLRKGYRKDSWCSSILDDLKQGVIDLKLDISLKNGLLFIRAHLIVSKYKDLQCQVMKWAT